MNQRHEFALTGRRRRLKPYHFKECGLPDVYLLNGVKIEDDPDHGTLVTIDNLPDLFMAIAFKLVVKPGRLTGPEMRFLRKRVAMTQAGLAKEMWVNEQTIANYGKGKTEGGPADRALRFLFLAHVVDGEELAQELRLEAENLMRPSRSKHRTRPIGAGPWLAAH